MRFSFALTVVSLASTIVAIPVQLTQRSILTDIDSAISGLEDGAGITAIEDELEFAFCGALSKLESTLGVTFAEKLLQLSEAGASPGDLQTIGKGVYYLEQGTGIEAVDDFMDQETGGAYTSLEDALGISSK